MLYSPWFWLLIFWIILVAAISWSVAVIAYPVLLGWAVLCGLPAGNYESDMSDVEVM